MAGVAVLFGAVLGLAACGGSDASDTAASDGTVAASAESTAGSVGPLAVAASSSDAKVIENRAGAGTSLTSASVEFTAPADVAGKADPAPADAACSGPGTVVEGESFAVSYTKADGAKVSAFSAKTQGSYEGPGSYSADFTWTAGGAPQTGSGTVFVYDDEASGEFEIAAATPVTGTWTCVFAK